MAHEVNVKDALSIDDPSTLPERTPEHSPLYAVQSNAPMHSAYISPHAQSQSQSRWTRWPFLLLASILIAVIAGLAGGFIGKAIESNHRSSSPTSASAAHDANPSSCSTAPTASSTFNPSSSQNSTTPPDLGCPQSSAETLNSTTSHLAYKLFCNTDWVSYDLVSTLAHTTSECIEACWSFNAYNGTGSDERCVGATFVPEWSVDPAAAWQRVQRASSCFLKFRVDGYPAARGGFDAVGLCFDDTCP